MNAHAVFCPDPDCPAKGQVNAGNIGIHSRTPPRYRCTRCQKTFSDRAGTPFYRRSIGASVAAFGFQRQSVCAWVDAAGGQCAAIHQRLVCQSRGWPLGGIGARQADAIRVKQPGGIVWVALARQGGQSAPSSRVPARWRPSEKWGRRAEEALIARWAAWPPFPIHLPISLSPFAFFALFAPLRLCGSSGFV